MHFCRTIGMAVVATVTLGHLSPLTLSAAEPESKSPREKKIAAAMAKLSAEDRKLAEAQRYCAVMPEMRLGAMGTPMKATIDGKAVFLCCDACEDQAKENPKATVAQVAKLKKIAAAREKLSAEDRELAESQRFCPVEEKIPLGSMGKPVKLLLNGKPVFLCCDSCEEAALAAPDKTLKKAADLRSSKAKGDEKK